jgi:hypothetical protein
MADDRMAESSFANVLHEAAEAQQVQLTLCAPVAAYRV